MPQLEYLNVASRTATLHPTIDLGANHGRTYASIASHTTRFWQSRDGTPALQSIMTTRMEDLEEIRTLMARYCFAIDSKNAAAFADLFTEDGVFDLKFVPPIEGREALRAFVPSIPDGAHHFTANEIIELDGDQAVVRAYVLVVNEAPAGIGTVGEYDDVVSRTPDGWRFARRTFTAH